MRIAFLEFVFHLGLLILVDLPPKKKRDISKCCGRRDHEAAVIVMIFTRLSVGKGYVSRLTEMDRDDADKSHISGPGKWGQNLTYLDRAICLKNKHKKIHLSFMQEYPKKRGFA